MSVYLDASVIVAFSAADSFSDRADIFLQTQSPILIVSDFAMTEFASAMARRMRMGEFTATETRKIFSNFDAWIARAATRIDVLSADVRVAEGFLRRLDLTLRAGDALNIAIAQRIGAELATFDAKMADCAKALGVSLAAL